MSTQQGKIAAVGTGTSDLARRSSMSAAEHAAQAIRRALADAGLKPIDIDGIATCPATPMPGTTDRDGQHFVSAHMAARTLGLLDQVTWVGETLPMIGNAFIAAVNALAAGACTTAVVFRAMHAGSSGPRDNAKGLGAPAPVGGIFQFTIPYGMGTGFQVYGGAYQRYQHKYGATREQMARMVAAQRHHATLNPAAIHCDKPLSEADYLAAPLLGGPFCLYDCDMPIDGAGAIVLTTAERARDLGVAPAYVAGQAQMVGDLSMLLSMHGSLGYPLEHMQESARGIADRLWRASGMSHRDVKVAQLYDGFSFFPWGWLEACGFCGEGEAGTFVGEGRTKLGGTLPVNTFGGQIGEGRIHGIGHLMEAARQASGRAGARQVPGAAANGGASLACTGPLGEASTAVLFTGAPR